MPYRMTFALAPGGRRVEKTLELGLFSGGAEKELSRATLSLMLDFLTELDVLYLRAHPETPRVYQSGVRYMEEPPGQERFQDIPTSIAYKSADCEDLACWLAAERRVRDGKNARAIWVPYPRQDGSTLFHIVVKHADGSTEDPSRVLGMK
jgi:hypothetical protein